MSTHKCRYCGHRFSARSLDKHQMKCSKRPTKKSTSQKKSNIPTKPMSKTEGDQFIRKLVNDLPADVLKELAIMKSFSEDPDPTAITESQPFPDPPELPDMVATLSKTQLEDQIVRWQNESSILKQLWNFSPFQQASTTITLFCNFLLANYCPNCQSQIEREIFRIVALTSSQMFLIYSESSRSRVSSNGLLPQTTKGCHLLIYTRCPSCESTDIYPLTPDSAMTLQLQSMRQILFTPYQSSGEQRYVALPTWAYAIANGRLDKEFAYRTLESLTELFLSRLQNDITRSTLADPASSEFLDIAITQIKVLLMQVKVEKEFVGLVEGIYLYLLATTRTAKAYLELSLDQRTDTYILAMKKHDIILSKKEEKKLRELSFELIASIYYEVNGIGLAFPAELM